MKHFIIVFASQDYDQANHKYLWDEFSKYAEVIVVNIPADYFSSVLTGKRYRISDAKRGLKRINNHLYVLRPLFFLRPEIISAKLYPIIAKEFWNQIESYFPDFSSCTVDILVYDGRWIRVLNGTKDNLRFGYYLYDEVRFNGKDCSINHDRTINDDYACRHADFILTMTSILAEHRDMYRTKKIIIGNGATIPPEAEKNRLHINHSVAFIGNLRDWIDQRLLTDLIQLMPDFIFGFVGPIEKNMKPFFNGIINNYNNTVYLGIATKNRMPEIYRMFDAVIIPYKQNEFIKATRPIKIVESIMSGTPVITVPVDGYSENSFIRFAVSANSFRDQIIYVLNHDVINENREEYIRFREDNSWEKKAQIIINMFDESRKSGDGG